MQGKRYNRIIRIKAVEVEYIAVRFAVDRLLEIARHNPLELKNTFKPQDLQDAWHHLENTYIVRLFAEFETGLRSYWSTLKATLPQTRDLIDGIRARRRIPDEQIANIHRVRQCRNAIVHERDEDAESVTIGMARHYLCKYFSYLPQSW
ncbi:MAG: hypothetical protein IT426_14450 [Pirellulales bacterium]|nr:hypothetical protein [Pirellulales bacterium]